MMANRRISTDSLRKYKRVLSPATEALIVKIGKQLETRKYNQIRAIHIQWYLKSLGVEPLPEIW